jgi:heme-degrading monooxygenase HmoA
MDAPRSFFALVIYPTTTEAQTRQVGNLMRLASEKISPLPGFRGARMFVSEDGESLVTLTEWADRESFQKFRKSEMGRNATLLAADLHPKAYWLREHGAIGGT